MLEEQLTNASKAASKKRLILSLLFMLVAIGALGSVAAVSMLWPSQEGLQENDGKVVASQTTSQMEEQAFAMRDRFKDELRAFETGIEPRVLPGSFALWNISAQHEIISAKSNAISMFTSGDYAAALSTLEGSVDLANTELSAMDGAFSDALAEAQKKYDLDVYDEAKVDITKALGLHPESPEAIALNEKIEALPQVLKLISSADVAHAENNLEREAHNLSSALVLAPERNALKSRLDDLEVKLAEVKFSRYIKNGLTHVQNKNLMSAKESVSAAQKLMSGRVELSILMDQVGRLEKTLKFETSMYKAEQAAKNENWNSALSHYVKASAIAPDNKNLLDKMSATQAIIFLRDNITRHLGSPNRLGTANVRVDAKRLVRDSSAFFDLSPSLKITSTELSELISAYEMKVQILVRSDNQTNILVRGVGRIGQTDERYIELHPGTYTFEGQRPGYKSRLVSVVIKPGEANITLEVICNERL